MTPDGSAPSDLAASVRGRLQNIARARKAEFQLVLSEYAVERFLYRLGLSRHASDFVLKGAMLFRVWTGDERRATWDLDLLRHRAGTVDELEKVVREICAVPCDDDAMRFDGDTVRGEIIRAAQEEAGVRLRFVTRLANMRIPVQVDVGFGDVVFPHEIRVQYPTMLRQPAPSVLAYPREAVVAEKVEAMVSLGVTNSRMKDFYDVRALAWTLPFDGPTLAAAIRATFERRGTPLPGGEPLVLTRAFLESPDRQTQWRAFLKRGRLEGPEGARDLSDDLRRFLGPVLEAVTESAVFDRSWVPRGPWSARGML